MISPVIKVLSSLAVNYPMLKDLTSLPTIHLVIEEPINLLKNDSMTKVHNLMT